MITTILIVALISSMFVNILLGWYTRKLLNYLEMTNTETRTVLTSMAAFETHLTEVYNKDLLYGDPTLEGLLKHTSQVADEIQEFLKVNEELTVEIPDA
tara:strand:+ start:16085 stop:16381 length:297 start_codon:yes stop_codon:yes gene_type:complete